MIKYLDGISYNDVSSKCPQVIDFCQKSGVGVSALGPFLSYGTAFDFADAWVQYDDEDFITAFILKFYGNVTVVTCEESEAEEIREFLGIIGYTSLLSEHYDIFPVPPVKTGCIMGLERGALCKAVTTKEEFSITDGEIFNLEDYRVFYSVLMKNNPGYICTSSDDFILDFSHRVRHGISCPVMLKVSGEVVSTTAAMCIAPDSVFLGAVSTNENCRGKHYAFTLIKYLCEKYRDKTIYLRCEKTKRSFYEKAGLQLIGDFYA